MYQVELLNYNRIPYNGFELSKISNTATQKLKYKRGSLTSRQEINLDRFTCRKNRSIEQLSDLIYFWYMNIFSRALMQY